MASLGREFAERQRQQEADAQREAENKLLRFRLLFSEAARRFEEQRDSFETWLKDYNTVWPYEPRKKLSFYRLSEDSFRVSQGLGADRVELDVRFHPSKAYFSYRSDPAGFVGEMCYSADENGIVRLYSEGKLIEGGAASDAILKSWLSRNWQARHQPLPYMCT